MQSFKSTKDAKEAIRKSQEKVNQVLNNDLKMLAEDQRSIGGWLAMFGKIKEYKDTREALLDLEVTIIDATLYLRHLSTSYDFNVSINLNDTYC